MGFRLAAQQWAERPAVHLGRNGQARVVEARRSHIHNTRRRRRANPLPNSRTRHDQRHAGGGLPRDNLGPQVVVAKHLAVIRREDDDGVLQFAARADFVNQATAERVDVLNHRRVVAAHRDMLLRAELGVLIGSGQAVCLGVQRHHALGDVERIVRAGKVHLQEPGPVRRGRT